MSTEYPDTEQRFAQHLRERREAIGWSQRQLAQALSEMAGIHLDPTAITRIERGTRRVSLNEAVALATVVGSGLGWMVGAGTMRTPDAAVDMWAVLLIAEHAPVYYGPFEEYDVAERFARFVTEEIDPARIVPMKAASIDPLGGWRSPLLELLNWRDRMAEVPR